jgi:hypothetical protein
METSPEVVVTDGTFRLTPSIGTAPDWSADTAGAEVTGSGVAIGVGTTPTATGLVGVEGTGRVAAGDAAVVWGTTAGVSTSIGEVGVWMVCWGWDWMGVGGALLAVLDRMGDPGGVLEMTAWAFMSC